MKKLYLATRDHSVMFLSNLRRRSGIMEEAHNWMDEQDSCHTPQIELTEIKVLSQIPDDWKGNVFLWGTDDEITAEEFLKAVKANDSEFREYLRLKAKYE